MKQSGRVVLRAFRGVVWLAAVTALGCEAGVDQQNGSGGAGANASTGPGLTNGTGGDSFGEGGGAPTCENHCTADLKKFVDCDGNVITECPPDLGCAPDGSCIEPCDAAAANKSTVGCEFFSVTPPVVIGSRGGCFAAMIANTWT